jgi:hypothetical protein
MFVFDEDEVEADDDMDEVSNAAGVNKSGSARLGDDELELPDELEPDDDELSEEEVEELDESDEELDEEARDLDESVDADEDCSEPDEYTYVFFLLDEEDEPAFWCTFLESFLLTTRLLGRIKLEMLSLPM